MFVCVIKHSFFNLDIGFPAGLIAFTVYRYDNKIGVLNVSSNVD